MSKPRYPLRVKTYKNNSRVCEPNQVSPEIYIRPNSGSDKIDQESTIDNLLPTQDEVSPKCRFKSKLVKQNETEFQLLTSCMNIEIALEAV